MRKMMCPDCENKPCTCGPSDDLDEFIDEVFGDDYAPEETD